MASRPEALLVITGFVAATPEGVPTTLKRNGSETLGEYFGALLDAQEIMMWTDVDGVLSADPAAAGKQAVPEMSYDEASELAYFGAKVLHPAHDGARRRARDPDSHSRRLQPPRPGSVDPVRAEIHMRRRWSSGFSILDRVALVNIEGTGMNGVPGVAQNASSAPCAR